MHEARQLCCCVSSLTLHGLVSNMCLAVHAAVMPHAEEWHIHSAILFLFLGPFGRGCSNMKVVLSQFQGQETGTGRSPCVWVHRMSCTQQATI